MLKVGVQTKGILPDMPVDKGFQFIKDAGFEKVDLSIDTFLKNANMDMVAVAFGNAHGIYKGTPKLNYDIVRYVTDKTNRPFVVHGGSGMSDEILKKLISINGVKKINISTDIKLAYREGILTAIKNGTFDKQGFQAVSVENDINNAIAKVAEAKLRLLDGKC